MSFSRYNIQRIIWVPPVSLCTCTVPTPVKAGGEASGPPQPARPSNTCWVVLEPKVQGQSYGQNGPGLNRTKPKEQQQGRNSQAQQEPQHSPHTFIPAQYRGPSHGSAQVSRHCCCSFRTCRLAFSSCSALMIYLIAQQGRQKYLKPASDTGTPQEHQCSVSSASLTSCSPWHQLSKAKSQCRQH